MKFKHVFQHKAVNSTNEEAKKLEESHTPFLITTVNQLAGKGRLGNQWLSGKNNFYCSLGITQENMPFPIHLVPLVTALVVRNFIKETFQISTRIKWPNDILFNEKKICGILIEKVNHLYIVGIGINLALTNAEKEELKTVTDIYEISGQVCDQAKLYDDFKNIVLKMFNSYGSSEKVIKDWLRHCLFLGKVINCRIGSRVLNGVFTGLGNSGQLLLDIDGKTEEIWSGEIIE